MRELIGNDDFLLLESDLIFDQRAITCLMVNQHDDVLLVSPITKFQDQYYVAADQDGVLTNCSVHREEIDPVGEFVGIHKLSHDFFAKMCADYTLVVDQKPKLGYEYELLHMSQSISPLYVLVANDIKWYEIDDEADLRYAEEHIAPYC